MRTPTLATLGVLALAALLSAAPQPATRPTTAPAPIKTAPATVIDFKGAVQVRTDPDQLWRKPVIGQQLKAGEGLRIGVRSSIVLRFEGQPQPVTYDRLMTVFDISKLGSLPEQVDSPPKFLAIHGGVHVPLTPATAPALHRPGPTTRPTTGPGSSPATWPHPNHITAVEGLVQFRPDTATPWSKAIAGIDLPDGAEVRVGPRSAILLRSDDKEITLDRLGIHKITRELYENIKAKTRMPYGRTRYDIDEAGIEHTSELVTPSSILAIRADRVSIDPGTPSTHPASAPTTQQTHETTKPKPPANQNTTR